MKLFYSLILAVSLTFSTQVLAHDNPQDTVKQEMIFDMPEQMPEFPGGGTALDHFIHENLKYPEQAKAKRIQGKVYIQFVVEKDGTLTDFKVRRGVHPLLDAEALRVLKLMPNWKPGSMRGKTVRTRYTVPITFALS